MKDMLIDEFQNSVSDLIMRHKSILDITTKFQETNARVNRAIIKSVTNCGCMQINAKKQQLPADVSFKQLSEFLDSHVNGQLCNNCREVIEKEIGHNLFYMSAICNLMGMSLYDVLLKEYKTVSTLGIYNLR